MASSSSTVPEVIKPDYYVFINYRGSEVKHTLAASIYNALRKQRLGAILDWEELQFGDSLPHTIEKAILSASFHIVIFSPHYAKSPWCLAELLFMIKTGKKIIPIYYYVEPSDLRFVSHGKGIYASAFAGYEDEHRYTPETIERWKMVLHKVSFYKGPIIHDQVDELKVPKEIVATIIGKPMFGLNETVRHSEKPVLPSVDSRIQIIGEPMFCLNETVRHSEKPVLPSVDSRIQIIGEPIFGLNETVRHFEKTVLPSADSRIQIVGIVGMGGCGKTTLARKYFNAKAASFKGSSFKSLVRNVPENGLPRLERELLKDLLADVEGITIGNINEDNKVVESYLRSRCVLIVLDDLDHRYQLEALMAKKDSFGAGSLIIITTRDKGILKRYDKSVIIYELKPMNRPHAEQLFSWHAFNKYSPPPDFEDLVRKFVDHCEGLPLTLKVLGGLLRGQGTEFWESQSRKISQLVTKEVQDRLKLSYDALDKERQNIFLDIACFYDGEDRDLTLSVWNRSGWDGERSLETLIDKSLVELDNRNRIKMHSQLRDLGRQIASKETPCRLYSEKTIGDYLDDEFDSVFQRLVWDKRTHPAALRISGNYIKGKGNDLTRSLQWLVWYDCPQSNFPSEIWLENLRILHLYNGFFNKLWLHDAKVLFPCFLAVLQFFLNLFFKVSSHSALSVVFGIVQLPKLLEELKILGSIAEFPKSIRQLEHLQIIGIDGWPNTSLKALPEEFCQIKSLENLTLRSCIALTSLPRHLGNLTNLQHLDLAFCNRLKELPRSFKQLVNLSHLNLQGCESLLISPHFLGEIRGLERVNFMDCRKLKVLPAEVPCQKFLRSLNLAGTSLEKLPNEVGRLVNLEVLDIGSSCLRELPISIGNLTNLQTLNLEGCKELRQLPNSLGLMKHLRINGRQDLKDALQITAKESIM